MNLPTPDEVEAVFDFLFEQFKRKNSDYGNSIFKVPVLDDGGLDVEDAIVCRASDKVERIAQLRVKTPEVVEESLDDTIGDLAVYLILWLTWRIKQREEGGTHEPELS